MTSVTKTWALALMVFTTLLTTLAQFFLKTGLALLPSIFTNVSLLAGVLLYVLGAALMIFAFKGGEVSVLYPIIATSYVWVALVSHFFLHEQVHMFRWIGIGIIVLGIILVSSRNTSEVPHARA